MIAPHNCYCGCFRAFKSLSDAGRFDTEFVDFTDTDQLRRVRIKRRPKLIWVETPSNPLLRITDITTVIAVRP